MSQRIISGLGSISKLINILENKDARNILLVTGKKSFLTSGALKPQNLYLKNLMQQGSMISKLIQNLRML